LNQASHIVAEPFTSLSLDSLFRRLEVAQILTFVKERRREDLTLDFKLTPRMFEHRDERKVLAIAIAGFGNSSGGLIVWGVNARKDDEGIDCAQDGVPITDPHLFMSRLVEHAAGAASPVVAGVQHRLIEGEGGPFAVTFVPESDGGPHMAKLGEDRYYKRSGDQFRKMEHFDIADMFGRRRKPVLMLTLEKEEHGGTVRVSITNKGRGIAKAPYLGLALPPNFRSSSHGYDGGGTFGLRRIGRDTLWRFGGNTTEVIHVGQTLPVTRLEYTVLQPSGVPVVSGRQTFGYEMAAEDCEMTTGECVLDY
jgi:hypothetical protein